MQITLSWQTIITAGAFIGAVVALVTYFSKVVRWVDKQGKQDKDIKDIKQHHEDDMKTIKEEQTLIVHGVLACLQGLQEKGCNGPVTKAIEKIETYLNQAAHK